MSTFAKDDDVKYKKQIRGKSFERKRYGDPLYATKLRLLFTYMFYYKTPRIAIPK